MQRGIILIVGLGLFFQTNVNAATVEETAVESASTVSPAGAVHHILSGACGAAGLYLWSAASNCNPGPHAMQQLMSTQPAVACAGYIGAAIIGVYAERRFFRRD